MRRRLSSGRGRWWLILALAAVAPFVLAAYPPVYDYYDWAYQGRLLLDLALGSGNVRQQVGALYVIAWQPIPNSAAPLGMALLNLVLGPFEAGRAFAAVAVLAFAAGFAYLVRTVQGRPTVLEFLGLAWAFGYFLSKGYVSYLVSLPVAFVVLARLHRIARRPSDAVSTAELARLAALGVLVYICHLMGWLVVVAGLASCAVWLLRYRNVRAAGALVLTAVPGVVLLAWYTLAQHGPSSVLLYTALAQEKAWSLIEPLMFFLRPDPFLPLAPTFWANVGVGFLVLVLVLVTLERPILRRASRPLLLVAGLLWIGYLVLPFAEFSLNRPDERFTLPALLVTLAALPWRPYTRWTGAAGAVLVLGVLGYHLLEYRKVSDLSAAIEASNAALVPTDARLLALSVHGSETTGGSCAPAYTGVSVGAPTLKWFDQVRLAGRPGVRTDLLDTALVYPRFPNPLTYANVGDEPRDLGVLKVSLEDLDSGPLGARVARQYDYVEAFGCPRDLARALGALAPEYTELTHGEGFVLLRRAGP